MEIKRHVGKHLPTNTRAIITYPVIPGTHDSALIVHIDRMNGPMKDSIMRTLDTQAAQSSVNFGEVLGRTMYADSGKSIFQVLHESGSLKKVTIDEVEMWPNPSMPIPLRTVLVESGLIPRPANTDDKFNRPLHNQQTEATQNDQIRAANLLAEAKLLEQDAERKKEEAYRLCPTLRPQPEPTIVEVAPVDPTSLLEEYAEGQEAPETPAE
jgi:hypothetical protein